MMAINPAVARGGGGFLKGISIFFKGIFKPIFWFIALIFSKWKISFTLIFIMITITNFFIMSVEQKDPTILFKGIGTEIVLADDSLDKALEAKPLSLPVLSGMSGVDKFKTIAGFVWDNLKIFIKVWFVFVWILLFYRMWNSFDNTKPAMNFTLAMGTYALFVFIGTFVNKDLNYPFAGIYTLLIQIIHLIPNLSQGFGRGGLNVT